jgi:hypothetical protein
MEFLFAKDVKKAAEALSMLAYSPLVKQSYLIFILLITMISDEIVTSLQLNTTQ